MIKTLLCIFWLAAAVPAWAQSPTLRILSEHLDADENRLMDWPELARYRDDNARLDAPGPTEKRVVFLGDSITDFWGRGEGEFFPGKPYVNRGISGQTTPQMLLRFRADVIALKPRVVVILAGTNDIAGNTGPMSLSQIEDNLMSMTELAQANGIRVVLSSLLPVNDYTRSKWTVHRPPQKIVELNDWIMSYAQRTGAIYLNYYSAFVDTHQFLKEELSGDGLHPNAAGYAVMAPLAQRAIDRALAH